MTYQLLVFQPGDPRGIAAQPFLRTDAPLAPSGVRAK